MRDVRRLAPEPLQTFAHLGALCYERRNESIPPAILRDALLPRMLFGPVRVQDRTIASGAV